ncbi:MAG: hypothetical protein FWG91_07340 [Lachnospiraceae bacterium]|nr:hypothetical protein [Lachnospiraceae bacterium]
MSKITVCVVGKDKRQKYLASYLEEQGLCVRYQEEFTPSQLKGNDYLVGPVTFYREGEIKAHAKEACEKALVEIINYMECEEFLLKNAELTAEGLLAIIIQNTSYALDDAKILILGNGRCGKAILSILSRFSCQVDIDDEIPESLPKDSYNIVINTIPAPVLTRAFLQKFAKDCVFFEIASPPGGFDKIAVEELNINLISCPGIPGLYSPQSAGKAIGQTVIRIIS